MKKFKGRELSQTPTANRRKDENKKRKKIMNSEPQPKRKKLLEEIDEQISEDEFDAKLKSLRKNMKPNCKINKNESKKNLSFDDDDDGDEEDDDDFNDSEEDDDDNNDEDGSDLSDDDGGDDYDDNDDDNMEITDDDDDDDDVLQKKSPVKKMAKGKIDKKIEGEIRSKLERQKEKQKEGSGETKKDKKKILKPDDPSIIAGELAKLLRNERSMFIKLVPTEVDVEVIKKMSPDITGVRFLTTGKAKKRKAFIEFHDPDTRNKNYESVRKQIKKISSDIVVDYACSKSKYIRDQEKKQQEKTFYSSTDLFVSGFQSNQTTKGEVRKLFPDCVKIVGEFLGAGDNKTGEVDGADDEMKLLKDHVTVCFKSESDCRKAKDRPIKSKEGCDLLVQFAKAKHKSQRRAYKKELKRRKRKEIAQQKKANAGDEQKQQSTDVKKIKKPKKVNINKANSPSKAAVPAAATQTAARKKKNKKPKKESEEGHMMETTAPQKPNVEKKKKRKKPKKKVAKDTN